MDATYHAVDATFTIRRLLPMEQKRVFMRHVRPLLRGVLSAETGAGWQVLVAAITDAPLEHYEALTGELYRHITYERAGQRGVLAGNEEFAFLELDMGHILRLDAQAFLVNFSESWRVVRLEFAPLLRDIQSLGLETPMNSSPLSPSEDSSVTEISNRATKRASRS